MLSTKIKQRRHKQLKHNVTKTVILNMPPKKKSFEFYQNFTEVLTLIFLKLFYKIEGEAHYQLKNIKSVFP